MKEEWFYIIIFFLFILAGVFLEVSNTNDKHNYRKCIESAAKNNNPAFLEACKKLK